MINKTCKNVLISFAYLAVVAGLFLSIEVLAGQEGNVKKIENKTESKNIATGYSSYIEYGLKITGFLVLFGVVLFQINRQYKSNLKLQQQHFKDKIKLQIFKEINERITVATNTYVELSSKVHLVVTKIDNNIFLKKEGVKPKPLLERSSDYIDYHSSFSKSVIELVYILEKYVITDRIFEIFNMALQSSNYELEKTFQPLNKSLLKLLPVDVPEEKQQSLGTNVIVLQKVSDQDLVELQNHLDSYNNKLVDLCCYLHDLKVQAQNILLGGVFDNKVSPRKPKDKKIIVVAKESDRTIEQLEEYFMYETEWGKNWQKAKQQDSS